jgi:hypothetical protein
VGTTSRGLRYPELTDPPAGPTQIRNLADDVNPKLYAAFPATSFPTGVANGTLVDRTDEGKVYVLRNGTWQPIDVVSGGGGGGGTVTVGSVAATYAGSAAQPITTATDVVVAFPTAQTTDAAITRNTSGAGHSFTLGQTRLWTITATLRFADAVGGGRTFELRAGSTVLAKAGEPYIDGPWTTNLAVTRKLNANTVITAVARHDNGASLALESNSGNYVHIDLAGI